jgi:hypothetical protein
MSVNLTSAERSPATPAKVEYTRVGESKREGNATYCVVESNAAGKPMYLQITRTRKGKDDAVKRVALAPIAAAVRLGILK